MPEQAVLSVTEVNEYLRMQMEGDRVIVEIRDTGIDMTPEVQKHIFEKFYQGDSSRHMEGNGLGLALVKRIVDLCEGTIQVESAPGEGSCFRVSLPLRQPQATMAFPV